VSSEERPVPDHERPVPDDEPLVPDGETLRGDHEPLAGHHEPLAGDLGYAVNVIANGGGKHAVGAVSSDGDSTVDPAEGAIDDGLASLFATRRSARAERQGAVAARFGQAVLRLRLFRGWTQKDVERASGVHQSQVSRLETGRQLGLSTRRVFAILQVLHVGDIAFLPPVPATPPTELELMLWGGDPWELAGQAAERRRVSRRRSA